MTLTAALHASAGLACLALGVASLLRNPRRRRNRLFAALSGALAIWTLGLAANLASVVPDAGFRRSWLIGSCLAAPLGLHFALALTASRRRLPRVPLVFAYGAAAGLWIAAVATGFASGPAWPFAAVTVLGAILVPAVVRVALHARRLPPGPERRAQAAVAAAAAVAIVGGLSDFLPRDLAVLPRVGPVALLAFVLVVSAVVVRHRFLDIDRFLAGAAAWIAGAAAIALAAWGAVRLLGASFPALFGIALVAIALGRPAGRFVREAIRESTRTGDPTLAALLEVSRGMARGRTAREIWTALEDGRRRLPVGVLAGLYLHERGSFRARIRAGDGDLPEELEPADPLAAFLGEERSPVTARFLDDESREADAGRSARAAAAADRMRSLRTQVAVPLERGGALVGVLLLGGLAPRALTADLAAAAQAIGNQALATFERADALEAAERRRALAAVGEMAAGLAHEVRNPVAAIHGAAQALGPDATEEQSRAMLRVIEEESARLGRFVGEFLDYARPGPPRRDAVDLVAVVRAAVRRATLAGLPVEVALEAGDPLPEVAGDADRLGRVADNLLRNAAEAVDPGPARMRIAIEASADGWIRARFEDNGPGIPEADRGRLFRPFFTTKPGGTGLGLALAHRIAEVHGGRLEAGAASGGGAAFTLFLPATEGRDGA